MIRILAENEQLVRLLPSDGDFQVEFHDRFGFVTPAALEQRRALRKAAGAFTPDDPARFQFSVTSQGGRLRAQPLRDCLIAQDQNRWRIQSDSGVFFLEAYEPAAKTLAPLPPAPRSLTPILVLIAAVLLPFALLNWMSTPEVDKKASEAAEAPVVLRTAPPPVEVKKEATPAPDPQAKARKVVTQNLGFLGLLGKKDFKKAVGGMPTPSKTTSAGAGPGGDQGSGGELIAGMGRGLHQTTIGNTRVSGLGGVGTKGAGGGQGGYGDTAYGGSGGGQTLSAIPLAQDAKVDEGLDRSQVQATILRYLSQVRACYEEGLKRNQAMIGQVTMSFEVGPAGQVNYSNVQRSSLNDRPVEDCIKLKMLSWKFPQPRGGKAVPVSYPFMLRPVKS